MFSASDDGFHSAVQELRDVFGRHLGIERLGPDLGVLTTPMPTVGEVADECVDHPIAFIRHLTVEHRRLPWVEASDLENVASVGLELVRSMEIGPDLAVQTWTSGSTKIGYGAGEAFHAIADHLTARGLTVARAGVKNVLSCCVTSTGVSLAVNRVGDSLADWPGGRVRLARDDARVSRSEFKLEELFQVFPMDTLGAWPPVGGRAIDLGAAPGGWTRILRQRGLAVWAVDPGDLHTSLAEDRDVHHVRTTAGEFFRSTDMLFDLAVNDMRMDPMRSCRVLVEASGRLRPGALAVVTLKIGVRQPVETLHRCLTALRERYTILFARQLHHNRHELTVVARHTGPA